MDVSIIIVNYNTRELIKECLKTVFSKTQDLEFEVIVVDNNSHDGSQEMLYNDFPNVILIENKENVGFGKANNIGVQKAQGKYIFLLNSDTVLCNNAVSVFFQFMETHNTSKIGAIGGLLLNQNMQPIHSSGSFPSKRKILYLLLRGYFQRIFPISIKKTERLSFDGDSTFEVDYITGADLFMSAELFKQLNGFDTRFFMYYEETDLQKRMDKLNLKRLIVQGPEIQHLCNASTSNSNKKRILTTTSLFIYMKKHSCTCSYWLFRIIYPILRLPVLFDRRFTSQERNEYFLFLFNC